MEKSNDEDYIDISKHYNDIINIDICINNGYIKFFNKPYTISDKLLTNILDNSVIYGSSIKIYDDNNSINNCIKKYINKDYSFPIIIYRKFNMYGHRFINNTPNIFNLHPLGLNSNTYVDGSSSILEFGEKTINNNVFYNKFQVLNNSSIGIWYSHDKATSCSSVYGGLYIPYIIKDKFSDTIDDYFILNENDFIFKINNVYFNNNNKYVSNELYPNNKNYSIINFNGNLIGKYTPLIRNKTNNINDNYNYNTDFLKKIEMYYIYHNILRIRLLNLDNGDINHYYSIIDNNTKKYLDFYVIYQGCGFIKPYKTNMIMCTQLDRYEILIDLKNNHDISLILFDFDIADIKSELLQKYGSNSNYKKLSIYNGCIIDNIKDNYINILNDMNNKDQFINILNDIRNSNPIDDLPFHICCKYNYKYNKCSKICNINNILYKIKYITTNDKKKYYYNYPNNKLDVIHNKVRHFYINGNNDIFSQSWFNTDDIPSILFSIKNCTQFNNLHTNNIIHITEIDNIDEVNIKTNNCNHWDYYYNNSNNKCNNCKNSIEKCNKIKYHTIVLEYTNKPINLLELKNILNNKFKEKSIKLKFNYRKAYSDIYGYRDGKQNIDIENHDEVSIKDIKIIEIILENISNSKTYIIEGNNNIMQILGIELHIINNYKETNKKLQNKMILSDLEKKENSYNGGTVTLINNIQNSNKLNVLQSDIKLELKPNKIHKGNPFKIYNEYIMNFSVEKNNTEIWKYINMDYNLYKSHSLNFHLTSGFLIEDPSYTSIENINNNNKGSKDIYNISPYNNISFFIKFSNYSSNDQNHLGYMFHCNTLEHHDMLIMGQYYVYDNNLSITIKDKEVKESIVFTKDTKDTKINTSIEMKDSNINSNSNINNNIKYSINIDNNDSYKNIDLTNFI